MLSRRAISRWFSNGKPPKMAPFDPKAHGLDDKFVLTNYTKMKGWGCKIPQNKLLSYLKKMPTEIGSETPDVSTYPIGPYTVTTTLDFFYPLN